MALQYYVPELNFWFSKYVKENTQLISILNELKYPEVETNTEDLILNKNSFIEMIFNDLYDPGDFTGKYITTFNKTYLTDYHPSTMRRLKQLGQNIECYSTDISGSYDIFGFDDSSSYEIDLLDKLYDYRVGYSVDLSSIDSSSLTSSFSKNIYNYLDLMVNGNYSSFDNSVTISDTSSVLDNMVELYVQQEAYKLISNVKQTLDSDYINLRPVRNRIEITEDMTSSLSITITEDLPYDNNQILFFKNGDIYTPPAYSITSDSTSITFEIDSTGAYGLNVKPYDIIIIDWETLV